MVRKSLITVLLYLGGDYSGGETTFDVEGKLIEVRGDQGDVVFFPHRLRHRGSLVTEGTKYMLRTDAMYFPLVGVGKSAFPSLSELPYRCDNPSLSNFYVRCPNLLFL